MELIVVDNNWEGTHRRCWGDDNALYFDLVVDYMGMLTL